jgi:hypothetical protein
VQLCDFDRLRFRTGFAGVSFHQTQPRAGSSRTPLNDDFEKRKAQAANLGRKNDMPKITLKATGSQAPDDMPPGEYVARCERGEIRTRGNKVSAFLIFSVLGKQTDKDLDREYEGIVLHKWFFLSEIKDRNTENVTIDVKPHSLYATAWTLAAGRPLRRSESPSPAVFEKKTYRVEAGYSSEDNSSFSHRNQARKKGPRDFLRIHSILEIIEEKAPTHMSSYGPNGATVNVHVHEHEHQTPALTPTQTKTRTQTTDTGIRMNGRNKEHLPKHAIGPGQPVKDSPRSSTTDSDGFDWETGEQESDDDGFERVPR